MINKSRMVFSVSFLLFSILLTCCKSPNLVDPIGEGLLLTPTSNSTISPFDFTKTQIALEFSLEAVEDFVLPDGAILLSDEKNDLTIASFCQSTCDVFVIFPNERVLRLSSPSFAENRPFTAFVWVSTGVVSFEQWTEPHHGVFYKIDVLQGALLDMVPITDE